MQLSDQVETITLCRTIANLTCTPSVTQVWEQNGPLHQGLSLLFGGRPKYCVRQQGERDG